MEKIVIEITTVSQSYSKTSQMQFTANIIYNIKTSRISKILNLLYSAFIIIYYMCFYIDNEFKEK